MAEPIRRHRICGSMSARERRGRCPKSKVPPAQSARRVAVIPQGLGTVRRRSERRRRFLARPGVLLQAQANAPDEEDEELLRLPAELDLLMVARELLAGGRAAGLITVLRDPRLHPVLSSVQQDPARSRTIERMAALPHMSRAAFALQFHSTVGEPTAAFVRRWRMLHARRLMRKGSPSIPQVAEAFGYRSESALRRAFSARRSGSGVVAHSCAWCVPVRG